MNSSRSKIVAALLAGLLVLAIAQATVAQGQYPGRPPGAGAYAHPARPVPAPAPSASTPAQGKKSTAGEQFFIVASVDLQKSQLLLKHPTEVTLLVKTDAKTQFLDETGKPIKLSDLRAGDTIWVISSGGAADATATRVRKGQMTVADLHRYYLDYPVIK